MQNDLLTVVKHKQPEQLQASMITMGSELAVGHSVATIQIVLLNISQVV